jgi:hypothetical protein
MVARTQWGCCGLGDFKRDKQNKQTKHESNYFPEYLNVTSKRNLDAQSFQESCS